jgi:hypothetical protein
LILVVTTYTSSLYVLCEALELLVLENSYLALKMKIGFSPLLRCRSLLIHSPI